MVMWYWSADTLFWQVSIDHNMDVQCQRSTCWTKAACLCQPIVWSMAAMLRDCVVVVVAVVHPASQIILVFWLVLTYDPLGDSHLNNVIIIPFVFLYYVKQVDFL